MFKGGVNFFSRKIVQIWYIYKKTFVDYDPRIKKTLAHIKQDIEVNIFINFLNFIFIMESALKQSQRITDTYVELQSDLLKLTIKRGH